MATREKKIVREIKERKKIISFYRKMIRHKNSFKHLYAIQIENHKKEIRELEKELFFS